MISLSRPSEEIIFVVLASFSDIVIWQYSFWLFTGDEASADWSKELARNFYILICCGYHT